MGAKEGLANTPMFQILKYTLAGLKFKATSRILHQNRLFRKDRAHVAFNNVWRFISLFAVPDPLVHSYLFSDEKIFTLALPSVRTF